MANWALVVGINSYQRLGSLEYAQRDAQLMRDYFVKERKFEQVFYFAEDSDGVYIPTGFISAEPTYGNLRGFLLEKHQGVITISACSPTQKSYEIEEIRQGSFTCALLEALRIQGEGNCATVERLYQHLRHRVAEINAHYQKPVQTPYAIVEPASKYHLILLPDYARLTDIDTLKIDAFQAEAEGDWELAKQLWVRVNVAARGSDWQAIEAFSRISHKQGQSPPSQETVVSIPETVIGESSAASEPSPVIRVNTELNVFSFDVLTVDTSGQEIGLEEGQAQYFREDLGNGVTLDMVSIPGGSFMMGTEDEEIERLVEQFNWVIFRREKPRHQVIVQPFFMGKYPITQAQWQEVAGWERVERELDPDPSSFREAYERRERWTRPLENISWNDAVEFCQRLSLQTGKEYRLPTEAEWEYACRSRTTTTTPFHFGETITEKLANYRASKTYADERAGRYREQTTSVGSFPPNAFGLYDMHGQVWEWCEDNWHENYRDAPTDGSAWLSATSSDKVVRGGSWIVIPDSCRSAYRVVNSRTFRDLTVGFRVVCVVSGAT